jgi:hypothetical protein
MTLIEMKKIRKNPRGYEKNIRYRFIKIKSFESSQKINFSTAGTKDFVTTVKKLIL